MSRSLPVAIRSPPPSSFHVRARPCGLIRTFDPLAHYVILLDKVREHADSFDIVHFHTDYWHFPLFRSIAGRTITTLHGRQDIPDLRPIYLRFGDMPVVSISNAQRIPEPNANFVATIHHGLPVDLHRATVNPRGGYVAFLGRICPEKR